MGQLVETVIIDELEIYYEYRMKTLKEFIREHYEIENNNYWNLINEDNYKYPDQEKFITTLAKNVYHYHKKYPNESNLIFNNVHKLNLKNLFFNKIELEIINDNKIDAGYIAKKSSLIDNKFDIIYIKIKKEKLINLNDVAKVLMHEFTHARQHYSGIIRGKKSLEDLSGKNSTYAKTLVGTSNAEILCKQILNRMFNFEQAAYLSVLHFDIDYKHCQDEDDLISKVKESDIYKTFEELYYSVHYTNNLNDKQKDDFVKAYNEIKSTNFGFNKIRKNLLAKTSKFLEKIISVSIDILHEYQDNIKDVNETIITHDKYFIRYLNDSLYEIKNNWFENGKIIGNGDNR